MVPTNWGPMCLQVPEIKQMFADKFPNCGNCECVPPMAVDQFGAASTRAATEIFATPLAAFLSGVWWFSDGARTPSLMGWKGCGDLRLDSDLGIGGAGASDCRHTGYYQVTCCVFWTIGGSAGLPQRLQYYAIAQNVILGASRALEGDTNSFTETQSTNSGSQPTLPVLQIVAIAASVLFVAIVVVILVVVRIKNGKRRLETV